MTPINHRVQKAYLLYESLLEANYRLLRACLSIVIYSKLDAQLTHIVYRLRR